MKINTKLAVLFTTLYLPAAAIAQSSPEVKVAGIRVINEIVGDDNDKLVPFNTFEKGTELALLIEAGGASIIKVDAKASTIDSFTDDGGKDLMVKAKGYNRNGFGSFPKVSKDGKSAMIEIKGAAVPNAKAGKVIAKGTLVVYTGSKTEKIKSQPFEPKKGTNLKVGDIELTVTKAGKPSFGNDPLELEFETKNKAITMVAGVKFYDAAGKEIESHGTGSSSMGFNKNFTYGQSYGLKKSVAEKVVLEFEVWTDLAEKKIPFSVAAGIGG
ncbi:MAG TPA: hypothetical protein EYG40_02555 [Verrucomicrobia bacterium]|nr:hypothetical protein [Verrucomicrobiales bacterium]HIL53900.1 hypothetical protein [Verrucomicrobiota bacterium]